VSQTAGIAFLKAEEKKKIKMNKRIPVDFS
jgi:hypothetical protein